MEYIFHILILVCIYSVLAASLDLLAGHAGLISFSQAGFYGIGAYASAVTVVHFELPFLVGVLTGMVIAIVASLLVSLPSLRLHGDYFVIATFGLQIILHSLFVNWTGLTGGSLGLAGIPPPSVFGWTIQTSVHFVVLFATFGIMSFLVIFLLAQSPFGRVLHAIREDELLVQSLGKNSLLFKINACAVSAALASIAGSLYAHYAGYIDPSSFSATESILVISMVIIGGAGNPVGSLLGAILLIAIPELLRFVGLPATLAANLRQISYGVLIVVVLAVRPRGLVGKYAFGE